VNHENHEAPKKTCLTIDDLRALAPRAHKAFMDFTEAQTMFWELSMDRAGVFWAEDHEMAARVQWMPEIGQWQ